MSIKYNEVYAILLTMDKFTATIVENALRTPDVVLQLTDFCLNYVELLFMLLTNNYQIKIIRQNIQNVYFDLIVLINELINIFAQYTIIGGKFTSKTQCLQCNMISEENNINFCTIDIPLPEYTDTNTTILNCFDRYIQNNFRCCYCNEKTKSSKMIHMNEAYDILVFTFDDFALNVCKIPYIPDKILVCNNIYKLTSCITMIAETIYITYVLLDGTWYMLDGGLIKQIRCGIINNMQRCKLLVYIK